MSNRALKTAAIQNMKLCWPVNYLHHSENGMTKTDFGSKLLRQIYMYIILE